MNVECLKIRAFHQANRIGVHVSIGPNWFGVITLEKFGIDVVCQIKPSLKSGFFYQGPCVFESGLRFLDGQWFEFGFEKTSASVKSTFTANEYGGGERGVKFAFELVMPRAKSGMSNRCPLLVARVHEVISLFVISSG